MLKPDYIFESSWEVCNKVGGIYTVLSTRAKTLQDEMKDRIIFIGPDCWKENDCPYFREEKSLFAEWQWKAKEEGLKVKVGRWTIPGEPIAILVDFTPYFEKKDEIYTWLWEKYSVDSLHAYGDYDEASMFSYAAALVTESLYSFNVERGTFNHSTKVIYHANEWMCGLGALYINNKLPQIGTIFTTHATSIGRSIAGNQKPLYDYLFAYNGDQMAGELNMQSKHSIEKQTAWNVDCFTTVSDITAKECVELLDKPVDVVLPNGFDDNFVPKGAQFTKKRKAARQRLLQVANALLGEQLDDDTLIISTSGRYEFRNKGIDVFVEAMNRLLRDRDLKKKVLAFIEVPGWVGEPRTDLQERLQSPLTNYDTPLEVPQLTHWLHNIRQRAEHDEVLRHAQPQGRECEGYLPALLSRWQGWHSQHALLRCRAGQRPLHLSLLLRAVGLYTPGGGGLQGALHHYRLGWFRTVGQQGVRTLRRTEGRCEGYPSYRLQLLGSRRCHQGCRCRLLCNDAEAGRRLSQEG